MDWLFGLSVGTLVYLAFAFDFFGFLARDELWLRLLMLAASALYLIYYFVVVDEPLWDALITNGVLAAVNLAMIFIVIIERTTFSMSHETAKLFKSFPMLSPGQFRRLIRSGERLEADKLTRLTEEGVVPEHLYFVINGPVDIEKNEDLIQIPGGIFIGELAFLSRTPATASVFVDQGSHYLCWRHEDLDRLTRRSPAMNAAVVAQFNLDLAAKVSNSVPMGRI